MNRTVAAVFLVIMGLLGLLMTACGGFFSIVGIFDTGSGSYLRGAMVLSLPSFLIGAFLCRFVWQKYRNQRAGGDLTLAGSATTPLAVAGTVAALALGGLLMGFVRVSSLITLVLVAVVALVAFVVVRQRPAPPHAGADVGDGRDGDVPPPPPPPPPLPPPPPPPPDTAD